MKKNTNIYYKNKKRQLIKIQKQKINNSFNYKIMKRQLIQIQKQINKTTYYYKRKKLLLLNHLPFLMLKTIYLVH